MFLRDFTTVNLHRGGRRSKGQTLATGKIVQVWHKFPHKVKLLRTGAMAGVKFGGEATQFPRDRGEIFVQRAFGKVKPADQNIRREPCDQVPDSLVGATAEKEQFAGVFDQQILLVAKIVRKKGVATLFHQSRGRWIEGTVILVAGEEQ